jgi:acetylornithine deacetylase/succinyl-diaminopimelate desuccinylase-like protein
MSPREPGAEERALLAYLEEREDELLEFARELIATPSMNPPGDERAVAELVRERLVSLGIADIEVAAAAEERPNLIARVAGEGAGPTLILNGHLDTKPAGDLEAWETDPWDPVVRDGELYGLGSGDMKAADAAMVYAAAALANAARPDGDLLLVFSADEEAGSKFGSGWLAESGLLSADAAIIGEPCGITREWEAIDLVSRGAALFKVRVYGTQMHSSISDRLPSVNATVKMARLIDRMDRELRQQLRYRSHPLGGKGPTVNVGVMAQAGIFYGVYPGYAEFACDIRTLPGMTREELEEDLERFLRGAMDDDPQLRAELAFEIFVPATEIDRDAPIVQALQAAAEIVLDEQPLLDAFPGATDASHIQGTAGIPTVAAFGPGLLPRAHAPNESLAIASVGQAAQLYALGAWRYLRG